MTTPFALRAADRFFRALTEAHEADEALAKALKVGSNDSSRKRPNWTNIGT